MSCMRLLVILVMLVFLWNSEVLAGNITYTYDNAGRLTKADYGGGKSITYEYDNAGNMTKKTVTTSSSIFADVDASSVFYNYIVAIYNNRYTVGCGQNPLRYCPSDNVTREQMAAFIIRAKEGEPALDYCGATQPFNDVPVTNNFCRYIKRLFELAITVGCGNGNYCPSDYVTREQMAAFIIRAKEGEPALDYCGATQPFNDVPVTNNFCRYIKRLFELRITVGCGNGNYCPSDYVTREQMAAFLARAFLGMQ